MRNLVLQAACLAVIDEGPARVTATAIDTEEEAFYVATQLQNADADVEVTIWKTVMHGKGNRGEPKLVSTFTSSSFFFPSQNAYQVVSMRLLPESCCLALIMRGGDIITIALDSNATEAEVVGSVDFGILASAWSPDESLLILVTGDEKLILMTSAFDVLSEAPLHTTDFGEDAPINVGWGSKQTQFHGSLGKAAAQAPSTSLTLVGSSPDDDALPRISWRGDGASFVISTLSSPAEHGLRRRVLRVYDREAALQSTSESVAGLEHPVAWRPSGNLIACTQRFGFEGGGSGKEGRHDVVFFERNGLRHGEFGLRERDLGGGKEAGTGGPKWGYRVREMSWSSDSNVLALWLELDGADVVQLWTTANYHWYLKQEIWAPKNLEGSERFTSVQWHPEKALQIILTTASELIQKTFAWETCASRSNPPDDTGSVAVVDGTTLLLTPFRMQNIPPPMSSCQLSLVNSDSSSLNRNRVPIHLTFSPGRDVLAILWQSNWVELWDLRTRLTLGRGNVMDPARLWGGRIGTDSGKRESRQILLWTEGTETELRARVAILGSGADGADIAVVAGMRKDDLLEQHEIALPAGGGWLVPSDGEVIWQSSDGELFEIDYENKSFSSLTQFPEFCLDSLRLATNDQTSVKGLFVGLSSSAKLYVVDQVPRSHVLAANVNSFLVASDFVIYTTSSHEANFIPVSGLTTLLTDDEQTKAPTVEWEKRRVERGSRIVTAVPSAMTLVLQMPRGNLEIISPRPLVLRVVVEDVEAGRYRKAFLACRKHRIDLSILVNRDQDTFMHDLSSFVDQVDDVEYINLFLTSLGQGSLPREVIAKLCDAIRSKLEAKDLTKYIDSILTSYVVKTPPDHEAALELLLHLRDSEPDLMEDAVKYIIFLVDTDRLLDTALGMYDFSIFLMIAQHAQKDPREYLPFLRELRSYGKDYQRFKIDDHLKRHDKALSNLSLCDRFDEAMDYVEKHRLYELALSLWKGTDRYGSVLNIYGDWLYERRDFKQAALVYVESEKHSKAMLAYEKALQWQELFDLAVSSGLSGDEIVAMAYRLAENLSSKKRHSEAATVLLDYSKDIRQAVITLVEGNLFAEARRIVTLHTSPELLTDIIYPGALESRLQLSEDVGEMREQLRKQMQRLQELRVKKIQEPDSFYGVEDTALHNVDVMTDFSMAPTAFTRYTVAPSTASRTSKRSSRSKRKMERKVGSGRKGTVDEEEYLLNSLSKLLIRFSATEAEAGKLLPHLFQFAPEHREEGLSLQRELSQFETELKEAIEEAWKKPPADRDSASVLPPADTNSWAVRMQQLEKDKAVNPVDKVLKPELSTGGWRLTLLDVARAK